MRPTRELTPEEFALVQNNMGLAQYLFHRQWAKLKHRADYGIEPEDLLSQAYFGLIRAAMRYRLYGEERGYSEESISSGRFFGVYARKFINGQMLDTLRKIDHVHTLVRKDYKTLVENGLGTSDKSYGELSEETGLSVERVTKVIRQVHSKPVSTEDWISEEQTIGDQISEEKTTEDSATESMLREALVHAWESLPIKQMLLIALKYYEGIELSEIAEILCENITIVRRYHAEALDSIYEALYSRLLEA